MFRSKQEMAAMFYADICLTVKIASLFLQLRFSTYVLVMSKTVCGLLSLILPKKYSRCTSDSGRSLISTEFTSKPTIWKTSVDHKCLQLKEEASGIID